MPQVFFEAEREDDHFPGASAHGGRQLTAQQSSGRTAQEYLDLLGIQNASNEAFPFGDDLDFVQAPGDRLPLAQSRIAAIVLLQQNMKLVSYEPYQLLILEVDIG
jgi:hypothetical protein